MPVLLYKLTCLTNLHMGSGDTNYDVIDLEVERDPVLGEPTMNASGVKGALRDFCKKKNSGDVEYIFGKESQKGSDTEQGSYRFFSADLLARPVRVSAGESSYLLATTPELLRHILNKLHAFSLMKQFQLSDIPVVPEDQALSPAKVTGVEGISVVPGTCNALSNLLGGDNWVLMSPTQLRDIDLPVMAHNVLENGISKNLWYEQVVPHESVFLMVIGKPQDDRKLEFLLGEEPVVQFGAGATTGEGYTRLTRLEG